MKLVQVLEYKKDTPGTYVYTSEDINASIPALYIRKKQLVDAFEGEIPRGIKVTVQVIGVAEDLLEEQTERIRQRKEDIAI